MESSQLKLLLKTLDDIRHENGVEFWYARELYPILGYSRWENFETPITRAKDACKNSGGDIKDHFHEVTNVGLNSDKPLKDIKLTRYACYLTALNEDPKKEEVAF